MIVITNVSLHQSVHKKIIMITNEGVK